MQIDMTLAAHFVPQPWTQDQGVDAFMNLLRALRRTGYMDQPMYVATPRAPGDTSGLDPLSDATGTRSWFAERHQTRHGETVMGFDTYAEIKDQSGARRSDITLNWGGEYTGTALVIEFRQTHPDLGDDASGFVDVVKAVTAWQRPMHLSVMPMAYLRDHWPLDRARSGAGWIGWVPFAVGAASVPEAYLVQTMASGTCIIGQPALWDTKQPATVNAVQSLDLRLNSLGVLPTSIELQCGTWGQEG